MWAKIGTFLLRYRIPVGITFLAITILMGWKAQDVRMSYKFGGVLPEDDSTQVAYQKFLDEFGEDGNVLVIGYRDPAIWELNNFNNWYQLIDDIKGVTLTVKGVEYNSVDSIFSTAHCYSLVKDTIHTRFAFEPIVPKKPTTQSEVDAIRTELYNQPFYENLLYKKDTDAGLMMVFVNADLFDSENRGDAIERIIGYTDQFTQDTGIRTYVSGMPYIRTILSTKVKAELKFFTLLSGLISVVLLLIFFRSAKVTFIIMSVVAVAVVIAMGTIALFDYPITMLMGLIPPLMIVTTVPNLIYLFTKYHQEYKRYKNKTRALARVIQKTGMAAFMINATTAVGFAAFIFTSSDLLVHFGVIASLNTMASFVISIIVFPIISSFLSPPTEKHLGHLNSVWLDKINNTLIHIVSYHRRSVYIITTIVIGLAFYGISRVQTTGNIVDDLPDSDRVITDLKWFESNFNGVMPFDVIIESQKKGQISKPGNLKKIEELQELLTEYTLQIGDTTIHPFSRSLSIVDAVKYAKQAFYNGDPEYYSLMAREEQSFIGPYIQGNNYNTGGRESALMDSTKSKTRIITQVADIGTLEMDKLMTGIRPKIDSIFNPEKYNITLTGTSVVFLEGTNYLVADLFKSLLISILVISGLMAFMFWSARMVLISFIPNIIPQLMTAGIMGYFGIPLKPSTILVFGIALGITVDNTIRYLTKYRQELKLNSSKIKESALIAIKEAGASMVYSSTVLFFGFGCFAASEFDGTRALGILMAVTMLMALITNLIVLPALLLSFQKSVTTKAFKEPFFKVMDEEDDLDYEEWSIQQRVS